MLSAILFLETEHRYLLARYDHMMAKSEKSFLGLHKHVLISHLKLVDGRARLKIHSYN